MGNEDTVFRSLEIIESRISEKLTVESIAGSVYFSKFYYSRLFREVIGDSVMEYVIKRKLTLAGRALLETDATVLDIALSYGFDSHEGFTRSFKAYMGVTPTDYRKYFLAAISKKTGKEKTAMLYSKATDEIIRELNGFIVTAKELAASARKSELSWYVEFWSMTADETDSFAERAKASLCRITSIAEHPDEISNRFAILKVIEDIAFEANVLAFHVGLTAVGRAQPDHVLINKPLCDQYVELARASAIKANKVARFLSELALLIFDDMRKTAARKIEEAIQKGRDAAERITGYAYIKDELIHLVDSLSTLPIGEFTVSQLDDCLLKLRIITLSATTDILRSGGAHRTMFDGLAPFEESLRDAHDFFQTLKTLAIPEAGAEKKRVGKYFEDITFQGSILLFYTRGEISYEKLGSHIGDEQKTALNAICEKVAAFIRFTQSATDESAFKEIADKLYEICSNLEAEADRLEVSGSALRYLANEYRRLADSVMKIAQ